MDQEKMKQLLNYAKLLAKEGETFEKDGEEIEAIPMFIKVVDILLLLAEAAPTYPDWTNYISKAEYYQKRAKVMISVASMKKEKEQGSIETVGAVS